MIHGKTILAIIRARGGSKGIRRKNICMVAGKPLIAWTIEEAKKSKYIDRLILSSEDVEIIRVAKEWGCEVPFVRPAELARDDTPGIEPILHAINTLKEEYDYIVLLEPTSPLRTVEDIDATIRFCLERNANLCVTVCRTEEHPWWMFTLGSDGRLSPLIGDADQNAQRQDLPPVYVYNGAVYMVRIEWLVLKRSLAIQPLAYEMPSERSVDIDGPLDFALAKAIIEQRSNT
jgi:N-acylneuraminate cytidylyltransferase